MIVSDNCTRYQLNKNIKIIRSDRAGEYESPVADNCLKIEIIH